MRNGLGFYLLDLKKNIIQKFVTEVMNPIELGTNRIETGLTKKIGKSLSHIWSRELRSMRKNLL